MSMFCFQCEQTAKGSGCTSFGVCGKDPETAALQDLLLHVTKGIAQYAHRARQLQQSDPAINRFTLEALFTTVTNVHFDPARLRQMILSAREMRQAARRLYETAAGKTVASLGGPAALAIEEALPAMIRQGEAIGIEVRQKKYGLDIAGLQELLTYGLKGTAAYADHALILGQSDERVFAFLHEALDYLCQEQQSADALLALCLRCGEANLWAMEKLDRGNTGAYGHPQPTPVRISAVRGKAILVSGHDLKDLHQLLVQTEGKGINVYTHGEMLPAHGYPGLKKFKHLVGNYGGAWQDQRKEFEEFPGAILMTTNCIQKPKESYLGRIFTSGLVAWPGVRHLAEGNFAPLIEAALAAPGFAADEPEKTITVGFAHQAVLSAADQVLTAIRQGAIKHIFLIGGCDGAKPGRNYYTDFALAAPKDTLLLTLACGKYRFNKLDFGKIGPFPRLLDIGQCNDAYSAIQIAVALAKALNTEINKLPLSLILSWYEQKAVCILLTLLHLGLRNIRLGPSLPAFVPASALSILQEKFNLQPITSAAEDLKTILGR